MSKYYNIRWRDSDNDELSRAVKNFNAKITRLERKNPELKNALPERVSVRQMKELIDTRQDLNRELNALRRFTKRGSEELVTIPDSDYNLKTTKWQKEEMSRRVGIINRKRKTRLDELRDVEMTSRGEKLGYTRGEARMGSADENALAPMNAFTPKMTRHDLTKKFRNIMRESQSTYWNAREQILKATYVKTLRDNFNKSELNTIEGIDILGEVIDAIDSMDFKDFYSIFESEGGNFEFIYYPDEEQYKSYLTALKSTWVPNYTEG